MNDWVHNPFPQFSYPVRADETATFTLFQKWPGALAAHYLIFQGAQTQGAAQVTLSNVLKRFACSALVSRLPDAALPELYETLYDLYSHYSALATPTRPLLPQDKKVAKRGKTNLPPEIRVEE